MYERVKDQRAWQLEQGQELSALKEKIDTTQEIGVANRVLDGQTAMGLAGLDGHVKLLEKQGRFLLDRQEQESNAWHNITFNLREEVLEGEGKVVRMSSSPANSCLLFCLQLRLSPTLLSSYDPYDDMIFMFMTHAWDYRHPTTITTLRPVFLAPLWEVPSGRWEVVFYSVRSASPRPSSLALETFPEEQDFL